jgi:hypothetical protein
LGERYQAESGSRQREQDHINSRSVPDAVLRALSNAGSQRGWRDQSESGDVGNIATAPAERLNASIATASAGFTANGTAHASFASHNPDMAPTGFGPISDFGAGETFDDLLVALETSSLGRIQDRIILHSFGSNASGYREGLGDITLLVSANIIEGGGGGSVPEPHSLTLTLLALLALCSMTGAAAKTRRRHPEL